MSIPKFVNKKILVELVKQEGLDISYMTLCRWENKGIIKPDGVKREGGGKEAGIYIFGNVLPQIKEYIKNNQRARSMLAFKNK